MDRAFAKLLIFTSALALVVAAAAAYGACFYGDARCGFVECRTP